MTAPSFPQLLRQGVWHTTSRERYASIVRFGAILPEPLVSDSARWGTARGPDFFPYVRHLGGVSLFEFSNFEPMAYTDAYPYSSWRNFVPITVGWTSAVWIRLEPETLGQHYISPEELVARWKTDGAYRHKLMPMIEAAHLGAIPKSAFMSVHEYDQNGWHDLA